LSSTFDTLHTQLSALCPIREAESEAARDWWPLAMVWRHEERAPLDTPELLVARPGEVAQVAAVLRLCSEAGVPVTPFAGRSGVCGGTWPVFGGVSLDLGELAGVTETDIESQLVTALAGTQGRALEDEANAAGLTIGHWPQSFDLASVGGWVACRGAGQYSTRYGTVADMVEGLEVALADGSVVRTGWNGPRAATGPDLTQLFVGSEGTLGVITALRMRAHRSPAGSWQNAWTFPDFETGLTACRRILQAGGRPAVLRLYDARESRRHFSTERGICALVVRDEAEEPALEANRQIVEEVCGPAAADGNAWVDHWLHTRNDVSGLGKAVDAGLVVDTCEVAAPWSALPALVAGATAAVEAIDGTLAITVHASHHYLDGACLYFTFAGQTESPDSWYLEVWNALMRTTLDHGGAISHHHGIGLVRGRFMEQALGAAFEVLRSVKGALDPRGILNPGKLGLPSPFGPPPWP
jgi:alkyldihydroxyacetonephosphate synthase